MKFTQSLKRNNDFLYIYRKGRFFAGRIIVVHIRPNYSKINKLGISVSKKAGNSVRRNRVRRLIRENYRLMEDDLLKGQNIVIGYRNLAEIPDFVAFKKEMKYIFKRLEIYKPKSMEKDRAL